MLVPVYIGLLHRAELALADSFRQVAAGHGAEPDVFETCHLLAGQCDEHTEALRPVVERYGEAEEQEPERLHAEALSETRSGPLGLLRDLQDLFVLASLVQITWTMVQQAGQALRDEELLAVVRRCTPENEVQLAWLRSRMKQAAPQALVVAG